MKVNSKTFAYKLYVFCHLITRKLFNNHTWDDYNDIPIHLPDNTNLCLFMRSVFIWTPIYFLIVTALIGGYVYVLAYLPYQFGGYVGYYNIYGVPLIFASLVVGLFKTLGYFVNLNDEHTAKRNAKIKAKEERHKAGEYTMWEIIVKYYKSTKEKVCPLIEIERNGESK